MLNVSSFFSRCGQITVLFRDAVVVMSGGFCGGCVESIAPGAPFSFSLAPLRGWSYASTQGRGARLSIIPSQHRSLRTGFEPGRWTRGKFRVVRYGVFSMPGEVFTYRLERIDTILCVYPLSTWTAIRLRTHIQDNREDGVTSHLARNHLFQKSPFHECH